MLVQEFIDRTGYQPSDLEWEQINQTYSDCSLDKDQFCSVWLSMNKEEVALQQKARRCKSIAYILSNLSSKARCETKSGVIDFFKEYFTPKGLRQISVLCNFLGNERKEGYIQIINCEIVTHFDYMHAAQAWYDNAKQSPIFKVVFIDKNKFWFELVRNIPMYDYGTVLSKYQNI